MANNIQNSQKTINEEILKNVPIVSPDYTVGKTIELIRDKKHWDTINYIYVLDQSRNLIGVLSVKELMRNQNETLIKNIMKPDPAGIIVSPHHERAPIVAIQHNIKAVPVFKIGTAIIYNIASCR